MVTVSAAFMAGLADPANHPQRIVFEFEADGAIISNEDIDVDSGVDFHETFCSETDLTIGLTPSSELSFVLFNDDRLWNEYEFGTFTAYIGVRLSWQKNNSEPVRRPEITISGTSMTVSGNGILETYELMSLGKFIAPRPSIVMKDQIDIRANDQMTLFDEDMPSDTDLGVTYPITAGQLLQKLCDYVDVDPVTTTFTNSTLSLSKRPDSFDDSTMREVLGWIAEAACANARFNRSGLLELAWFNDVTASKEYDESNYTAFEPTWFESPRVSKIHIRNEDSTAEAIIGTGDVCYMIQNNPFLRQSEVTP